MWNRTPRVLVLQVGARLHYGVPAVYSRHGALSALYTDATSSKGVLKFARHLIPQRVRGPALRRLLGRELPPEIDRRRVEVATLATLFERLALKFRSRNEALVSTHSRLRRRITRRGFGDANCVYSVDNADLELLRAAKNAGLAVLYEQVITPLVGPILREERDRFPGLEPQDSSEIIEGGITRDTAVFKLADGVVCASEFVRHDICSLIGDDRKVHVVPYGIEESWLSTTPTPVAGRILFVGSVGLRKGNHYLAEASRLLKDRNVPCEIVVVGPGGESVGTHALFLGPNYLGQVPRSEVRRQFAMADIFAFPTLAEGFALAHLEALAMGVPVITTPNCGSLVRDGLDGFIVPTRNAAALADRLEQLVRDRALRARMSVTARERASQFTWARYGEQLMRATNAALEGAATSR